MALSVIIVVGIVEIVMFIGLVINLNCSIKTLRDCKRLREELQDKVYEYNK